MGHEPTDVSVPTYPRAPMLRMPASCFVASPLIHTFRGACSLPWIRSAPHLVALRCAVVFEEGFCEAVLSAGFFSEGYFVVWDSVQLSGTWFS